MKNLVLLVALLVGFDVSLAGRAKAQTLTSLHGFTGGSDGATPGATLLLSSNTLYGTAISGGSSGYGTVFKVNTNGTGFTVLHDFTATIGNAGLNGTNSDGAYPVGGLVLSGDTLYGAATSGGNSGNGVLFAVNIDGTGFTILHSFSANPGPAYTNSDGSHPNGSLVLSGNTLYGTTYGGGSFYDDGTVFAVRTDGTGFTTLHSFNYNVDGANPPTGVILSGNRLYGTTLVGGSSAGAEGTVFTVTTNGTGFVTVHTFFYGQGDLPQARLTLSGNTLYGAASSGGAYNGTVFAVNINGTDFRILHDFTATTDYPRRTNSDGFSPYGELFLLDNTLYGTAFQGGSSGIGTVFAVNTNGQDFTSLYNFTAPDSSYFQTNSDGANPQAGLILSGNTLYGTTLYGGGSGHGTIFSLTLPPPRLKIIPAGTNVILSWPTNAAGFVLQATANLSSAAVWSPVSPPPVIVNGQNTVTNAINGTQKFYRLSQ